MAAWMWDLQHDFLRKSSFQTIEKLWILCTRWNHRWGHKGSFSFSPLTSHELQYISLKRRFMRLSMMTKYVCRGLISLYVNFHNNRSLSSTNLHVKRASGGKEGKRAVTKCSNQSSKSKKLKFSILPPVY